MHFLHSLPLTHFPTCVQLLATAALLVEDEEGDGGGGGAAALEVHKTRSAMASSFLWRLEYNSVEEFSVPNLFRCKVYAPAIFSKLRAQVCCVL